VGLSHEIGQTALDILSASLHERQVSVALAVENAVTAWEERQMILPILLVLAALVFLALLAILLLAVAIGGVTGSVVGGILAGAGVSRRPKLRNGWRTAIVMFGTLAGGLLGAVGLAALVIGLLYFEME
jgi:hypothetical protein